METGTLLTGIRGLLKRAIALRRQDGISLVEVLVALAITGGTVAIFLTGLSTGTKGVEVTYEQTMAENVARSQLEYTKSQEYLPVPASYDTISSLPVDFTVSVEASAVADRDEDIQKITVTVYRSGETVLVKESFKVNR